MLFSLPSYLKSIAAKASWFLSLSCCISFDKVAYSWFLYFQHALCLYQLLLQTLAIHSFSVSGSYKVLYWRQDVVRFGDSFIRTVLYQQFCSKREKLEKPWKAAPADFIHQDIRKNLIFWFCAKTGQLLLAWSPAKPTLIVFNLIAWSPDEKLFKLVDCNHGDPDSDKSLAAESTQAYARVL